jgi:hypothetical protein
MQKVFLREVRFKLSLKGPDRSARCGSTTKNSFWVTARYSMNGAVSQKTLKTLTGSLEIEL